MKNTILQTLSIGLVLLTATTGYAQCDNINGDMQTYTSTPVSNDNDWINNDLTNWKVSHGTPTITGSLAMWMWSYNGLGEGVYTDYNFIAGETYTVTYDLWKDTTSNPVSVVNVELATGLPVMATAGSNHVIPTPTTSQSLTSQPWAPVGWTYGITETFVAGANYSSLWFYPYLAGAPIPWSSACIIDNVCIVHEVTDPCDFEPVLEYQNSQNDCTIDFMNATAVPTGFTILETSWDFGDGTTGTGDFISHAYIGDGSAQVYNVCMTVWMTNGTDCCKLTICKEIEVKTCDPCKELETIDILTSGTGPITFSALGLPSTLSGVYAYYWDFGDGTTGLGQTVVHDYIKPGKYEVCVTVFYFDEKTGECCKIEHCITVEVSTTGGQEMKKIQPVVGENLRDNFYIDVEKIESKHNSEEHSFSISPNPSNGTFMVTPKGTDLIENVSIYNQSGEIIYNSAIRSKDAFEIKLPSKEKGVYFLMLNENGVRKVSQIVIE